MRANDQNALNLPGQQVKATTDAANCAHLSKLYSYLRGLPHYEFTEKGRANICRRFVVSPDELADAIAKLQSPRPGQPTPELLDVIGKAVSRPNKAKGGAGKC
jgi:hypothetical protein